MNLDEDISVIIKGSVQECSSSSLTLKDYKHIDSDIDIVIPYLQNAITSKQNGVNILLYGLPGTGKTELTKVLAKELDISLFEVSYMDIDLSTGLDALIKAVDLLNKGADIAVGTRLSRESNTTRCFKREFISRSYNIVIKLSLGTHFNDAHC